MKYHVVSNFLLPQFEKLVQSYLDKGWKCQGGIQIVPVTDKKNPYEFQYFQALVKEN